MDRVADRRGQRAAQKLTAAGRLRLPSGYAAVLAAAAWRAQAMGPPGLVPGQAAFQAACRLRTAGLGPKGAASLLVETRPADDSGCPVGCDT
eukprot:5308068-Alexandrium_andersonii.AAC.1